MESNRKLRKGFMKTKLAMSFYRAAKPSPPMPYTTKPKPNNPNSATQIRDTITPQPKQNIAPSTASSVGFIVNQDQVTPQAKQKVSFVIPDNGRDSYQKFESPYGVGGDESVDLKAASYISCVQERFRLERLNSERNMSHMAQDMH